MPIFRRQIYQCYKADILANMPASSRDGITVAAFCEAQGCGHDAIVSRDGWPEDMPMPDMALRLRCSNCGSQKIKTTIDVVALYARTPDVGSSPFGR
jgi:hypothetical protein